MTRCAYCGFSPSSWGLPCAKSPDGYHDRELDGYRVRALRAEARIDRAVGLLMDPTLDGDPTVTLAIETLEGEHG